MALEISGAGRRGGDEGKGTARGGCDTFIPASVERSGDDEAFVSVSLSPLALQDSQAAHSLSPPASID